ncbi:MAG TPA: acyloxyacyl hydrolase [Chthoniobacterales bacterium]
MRTLFSACALALLTCSAALAGMEEPSPAVAAPEARDIFERGSKEFQNVTGAYFYFDTGPNNRPSIDYSLNSLRLGVMLNDPAGPSLLRGNFELLGEIFAGPVVEGPGNVLAGATLVFRYNFVQPHARLVPYLQIGAGGVYSDIPEKESRGLISLPVEFNLQGIAGTRIMLNDHWSITVEGAYRHISNAEIKKPNFGIDSVGGNLGFGFFF